MNKKQLLFGLLFGLGLFFTASYSIDNRGFHSGIYGVIGCLLMLSAYCGFNWDKLKAHDHHTWLILGWVTGITILIVILDIAEAVLA
ncbi:hypothetical protein [Limosilactobacillus pontis]|uniref:hypothetical protein n=1 Tax=Limosilactobacillus pontis TaxID=35787 RepID=UPI001D460086|nr:hypothetical protein [Limosilactobacillus pontis]HJE26303.1 hypothetical protein [Limosilactobacillus pontis]